MGRKSDRSRKATARNAAEQSKRETQKMIDRILKSQNYKVKGAM